MKSLAAAAVVVALAGCQHGNEPTSADAEYRADIARLCDSLQLSGADKHPRDEQWATQAIWLATSTKTTQAHDFFVKLTSLQGEARAKAMDDEAHRLGFASCVLSAEWRR
jgi:hypothetical protein